MAEELPLLEKSDYTPYWNTSVQTLSLVDKSAIELVFIFTPTNKEDLYFATVDQEDVKNAYLRLYNDKSELSFLRGEQWVTVVLDPSFRKKLALLTSNEIERTITNIRNINEIQEDYKEPITLSLRQCKDEVILLVNDQVYVRMNTCKLDNTNYRLVSQYDIAGDPFHFPVLQQTKNGWIFEDLDSEFSFTSPDLEF